MACGTPILAAFDTDSELSSILTQASVGHCVDPENAEVLAEAILAAFAQAGEERPNGGRTYVEQFASQELCVGKYVELFQSAKLSKESKEV